MMRVLPALFAFVLLGGCDMLDFASNALPKEETFGCYDHPRFGRIEVTQDRVAYNGEPWFERYGHSKGDGELRSWLIGNPHYAFRAEGDRLTRRIVKSGDSAQHFIAFDRTGERATLTVELSDAARTELAFEQADCGVAPAS